MLRDFHGARDAVQSVRGLTVGRVDIAAAPFLAPHPLPLLVAAFRRRYPGVAVRVLDPRDGDVHAAVRSGEAEVGLSGEPAFGDDLRSHTLPERETFLALPPGAEGVSRERVVESGEEIRLVVWSKYRVWASQLLAARGIPAEIVAETEHQASIVPFVVAGVGGALLAGVRAVEVEAQGGVLCHLTPPVMTSAFLISPVEGLAPAAAAFWELVLREGQEAYAAS